VEAYKTFVAEGKNHDEIKARTRARAEFRSRTRAAKIENKSAKIDLPPFS
jgi:hypothetical protein